MIKGDVEVIGHIPPYKRIDITHPGRKRVITREMIDDNLMREPCSEAYEYDFYLGNWILKE